MPNHEHRHVLPTQMVDGVSRPRTCSAYLSAPIRLTRRRNGDDTRVRWSQRRPQPDRACPLTRLCHAGGQNPVATGFIAPLLGGLRPRLALTLRTEPQERPAGNGEHLNLSAPAHSPTLSVVVYPQAPSSLRACAPVHPGSARGGEATHRNTVKVV